ncbi:MAG: hypothetical protein ACREC5_01215 [Thermoplasmata archaeon]
MSRGSHRFTLHGPKGRRNLILIVAGVVAFMIDVELILFVFAAPPPTVTLESARVTYMDQGTTPFGTPWFGFNSTTLSGAGSGYPASFPVGSEFNFTVVVLDADTMVHTLVSATVGAPFSLVGTYPGLPVVFPALDDSDFTLTVRAPPSAGTFELSVVLVAGA